MGKRLVDIDEVLLEQAKAVLGAGTYKEAVNRALAEVVAADRRRRHAQRLVTMDGVELDDPEVMGKAWH